MSILPSLDEDQLQTLAVFLEDIAEKSDGLDFFALHGLLTANAISPKPISAQAIQSLIFDGQPQWENKEQQETITSLINKLQQEIIDLIESGQSFPVPCDLCIEADEDDESAPLESWSIGFVLLTLEQQDAWYKSVEDQAAELLFPILYASGLNADEKAFSDIDEDANLSMQVCEDIPDTLVDLFLLYHGESAIKSATQPTNKR